MAPGEREDVFGRLPAETKAAGGGKCRLLTVCGDFSTTLR